MIRQQVILSVGLGQIRSTQIFTATSFFARQTTLFSKFVVVFALRSIQQNAEESVWKLLESQLKQMRTFNSH